MLTKKQLVTALRAVKAMPYARLCVVPYGENKATDAEYLTVVGYHWHMSRDRPWHGSGSAEAYYDDAISDTLQKVWWSARNAVMREVRKWEAAHKGSIPAAIKCVRTHY